MLSTKTSRRYDLKYKPEPDSMIDGYQHGLIIPIRDPFPGEVTYHDGKGYEDAFFNNFIEVRYNGDLKRGKTLCDYLVKFLASVHTQVMDRLSNA